MKVKTEQMESSKQPKEEPVDDSEDFENVFNPFDLLEVSAVDTVCSSGINGDVNIVVFEDPPFRCPDCYVTFPNYSSFRYHVIIRHGKDPVVLCDICAVPCSSMDTLTIHKRYQHTTDDPDSGLDNVTIIDVKSLCGIKEKGKSKTKITEAKKKKGKRKRKLSKDMIEDEESDDEFVPQEAEVSTVVAIEGAKTYNLRSRVNKIVPKGSLHSSSSEESNSSEEENEEDEDKPQSIASPLKEKSTSSSSKETANSSSPAKGKSKSLNPIKVKFNFPTKDKSKLNSKDKLESPPIDRQKMSPKVKENPSPEPEEKVEKVEEHNSQLEKKQIPPGEEIAQKKKVKHRKIGKNDLKCEDCGSYFPSEASLENHRIIKHGFEPPEIKAKCAICGKGFKSWSVYKRHDSENCTREPEEKKTKWNLRKRK